LRNYRPFQTPTQAQAPRKPALFARLSLLINNNPLREILIQARDKGRIFLISPGNIFSYLPNRNILSILLTYLEKPRSRLHLGMMRKIYTNQGRAIANGRAGYVLDIFSSCRKKYLDIYIICMIYIINNNLKKEGGE